MNIVRQYKLHKLGVDVDIPDNYKQSFDFINNLVSKLVRMQHPDYPEMFFYADKTDNNKIFMNERTFNVHSSVQGFVKIRLLECRWYDFIDSLRQYLVELQQIKKVILCEMCRRFDLPDDIEIRFIEETKSYFGEGEHFDKFIVDAWEEISKKVVYLTDEHS